MEKATHVVMISWNNHIPRSEAATPRTAEETICVMGEVTLIESKLAMFIRKPRRPYDDGSISYECALHESKGKGTTVMRDP